MNVFGLPVLLAAGVLLIVSSWKLITDETTSVAAAGALLGAGLVLLGIWVLSELWGKNK